MEKQPKKALKTRKNILFLSIFIILFIISLFSFLDLKDKVVDKNKQVYIASNSPSVVLYDLEFNEALTITRGTKVKLYNKEIISNVDQKKYNKIVFENKEYLINVNNINDDYNKVVLEEKMYIRTPVTLHKEKDSQLILSMIKKGEEVEILGYTELLDDGNVSMYKVSYNDLIGYVYGKYLLNDKDLALLNYDEENTYKTHLKRTNTLGGGSAGNLDYYPVVKPSFENNVMPDEVRSLYLNSGVIRYVDKYIELAKENNINAFVVDIKDNTSPGYASLVMKEYSPTNYKNANNSFEVYKNAIKKLIDNGFYVIGRITVFKDNYYTKDHPEHTIMDTRTNAPYNHDNSFWPSAFKREVWEFNVALALEAVKEMGFHEIQFDYVRFPDRTINLEKSGYMDFQNQFGEDKAQAIQGFLMYATDKIHEVNAYVSADVFGESAHNYVTGYGQYWSAISNVVDVISGMPYPDHFNKYEYDFKEPVWTIPYDLLYKWGGFVMKHQNLIPTPAVVRTWIQCYNTGKSPSVEYDATKISEQIQGLYDAGLTGGYMTWNSGSSFEKYESISSAFKKVY